MNVTAFQTKAELVGYRLTDQAGARGKGFFDDRSRTRRRRLSGKPIGISGSGSGARDIDQILDCKCAAIEDTASRRLVPANSMGNESTEVACTHLRIARALLRSSILSGARPRTAR